MNNNNEVSEIFDVLPKSVKLPGPELSPSIIEHTAADDDINLVRANLKDLMATTSEALGDALELARLSENPKAYEAVTNMILAAKELNRELIATHQTQQKMKNDSGEKIPTSTVTNNVLFTGTPAELSALLKKNKQ